MKVLKISRALIKQLEEMDLFLQEIAKKEISDKKILVKNTRAIFEIKKRHQEFRPVELAILDNLLIELNEILRFLIRQKLDFKKFVLKLDRLAKLIDQSVKNAYYDFFKLCGQCASCCKSPHIFSFEHDFIDKHRKFLKRKGLAYITKSKAGGRCIFYDEKSKKCAVYKERPLDCTFFPFTFIIKKIIAPTIKAEPRNYIFLCKATKCEVIDRLSLSDALEALEIICYILSRIKLKEAIDYSNETDPRKITFDISIPYDDRVSYQQALKQILPVRLYRRKN